MKLFDTPWRISGVAGLLFVALSFLAAGINVQPPAYLDGEDVFVPWFAQHAPWFRMSHFLAGLAFLLFYFPFFAGFCERLREAEGTPALWSRVTWAGAIISPAAGTVAGAFLVGLALLEGRAPPDVARFGAAAHFYALVVSGAYGGVVMLGASAVILRTRVFRRWLGWAGGAIGVMAITGTAAIMESDPAGAFAAVSGLAWFAYFLWIAAISLELVRLPVSNG